MLNFVSQRMYLSVSVPSILAPSHLVSMKLTIFVLFGMHVVEECVVFVWSYEGMLLFSTLVIPWGLAPHCPHGYYATAFDGCTSMCL